MSNHWSLYVVFCHIGQQAYELFCFLFIKAGSPFREPLIKFLTRHPSQTVELFMMEATLNDPQWSRMFMVNPFEYSAYKHFFILGTGHG